MLFIKATPLELYAFFLALRLLSFVFNRIKQQEAFYFFLNQNLQILTQADMYT